LKENYKIKKSLFNLLLNYQKFDSNDYIRNIEKKHKEKINKIKEKFLIEKIKIEEDNNIIKNKNEFLLEYINVIIKGLNKYNGHIQNLENKLKITNEKIVIFNNTKSCKDCEKKDCIIISKDKEIMEKNKIIYKKDNEILNNKMFENIQINKYKNDLDQKEKEHENFSKKTNLILEKQKEIYNNLLNDVKNNVLLKNMENKIVRLETEIVELKNKEKK